MTDYRKIFRQQTPLPEGVRQIIQLEPDKIDMISQEFLQNLLHNPNPEISKLLEKLKEDPFN